MRRSLRLFGVAAFAMFACACTSTVQTTDRVAQRITASPAALPMVEGLMIEQPAWRPDGSDWELALTWDDPVDTPLDHYEVWRDGRPTDRDVPGPLWTDRQVDPGTHYEYAVVGITAEGARTPPGYTSITTATPPVAAARLEGWFVMAMRVDEAQGTDDPVEGGKVVFRFEPTCRLGVCSVRLTVRERSTDMTLTRSGALYTGRAATPFLLRNCFGDEVDELVIMRLRVADAESVRGQWRASTIEGTIEERSAWKGCMEASIRWDVRGTGVSAR